MGKHALIRSYVGWESFFVAMLMPVDRGESEQKSQDYTATLPIRTGHVNVRLDAARKPSEVLAFYGVKKGTKWPISGRPVDIIRRFLRRSSGPRRGLFRKPHRAAGIRRALEESRFTPMSKD